MRLRRLEIRDLGFIEYGEAHRLQLRLVEERAAGRIPDTLLLLEHPHVITLGRRMKNAELRLKDIPVYRVERGGEATYHGPGQLVGYPIIDLNLARIGIKEYVWRIEEALIKALREFEIEAGRLERHPGVWVHGKKIASIGIAVRWWITFHGFALNVHPDLSYFKLISPCGLEPEVMTSMEKILGKRIDIGEVKRIIVEMFAEVMNYDERIFVE